MTDPLVTASVIPQPSVLSEEDPGAKKQIRAKLRASLDDADHINVIHNWLNKWKPVMSLCVRSGGVWDERYTVVVPHDALHELPGELVASAEAAAMEQRYAARM